MTSETWVDLGDGLAIDASRVGRLAVHPPWPPSMIIHRPFIEMLNWTVEVLDSSTNVLRKIACYPDEAGARLHARQIVAVMLTAADRKISETG